MSSLLAFAKRPAPAKTPVIISPGRSIGPGRKHSMTESASNGPSVATKAPASSNGRSMPRHMLDFEKHLGQLETQIQELEALQQQRQVDYSKELRQLRNNYTS